MNIRNATATWSGYLHQGKLGLMLALIEIEKLLRNNESIEDWIVEFEAAEDVDIIHGDIVHSRHQVKAYTKETTPSGYKSVLSKFDNSTSNKEPSSTKVGFQCNYMNPDGSPTERIVDQSSRFLHTVVEVRGFGLSEDELKEINPKLTYVENQSNVQLYEYPDGNLFCSLVGDSKIQEYCLAIIEEIFALKDYNYSSINAFNRLLFELDNRIRICHTMGKSAHPKLTFEEVVEIISDNTEVKKSNIMDIRSGIANIWTSFQCDIQIDMQTYQEEMLDRLDEVISEIYCLEDDHLIEFMSDINPQEFLDSGIENAEDVASLLKKDPIQNLLFHVILSVVSFNYSHEFRGYNENGGYFITLITDDERRKSSLLNKIMINRNLSNLIFDRRYLVNEKIGGVNFNNLIENYVKEEKPTENWKDVRMSDGITNSELEFITVDDAIQSLRRERK